MVSLDRLDVETYGDTSNDERMCNFVVFFMNHANRLKGDFARARIDKFDRIL